MDVADLDRQQVPILDPQTLNGYPLIGTLRADGVPRQAHTPLSARTGMKESAQGGREVLAVVELSRRKDIQQSTRDARAQVVVGV